MKLLVALIAAFSAAVWLAESQCPTIISRAAWSGRDPISWTYLSTYPATYWVIHHSNGASCSNQASCAAEVRAIQDYHMFVNRYADIGYNFLIGGDGSTFAGRGWDRAGAHTPSYNTNSHAICFLGTFTSALPTAAAKNAAQALIRCGVSLGHVRSTYNLMGHRQAVATECPGNMLYEEIKTWPNFRT